MDWHTRCLPSLILRIPSWEINGGVLIPLSVLTFIGVAVVAFSSKQVSSCQVTRLMNFQLRCSWENVKCWRGTIIIQDHTSVFACWSPLTTNHLHCVLFQCTYIFQHFPIDFLPSRLPFVSVRFTELWTLLAETWNLIEMANPSQSVYLVAPKLCYLNVVMQLTAESKMVHLKILQHLRFESNLYKARNNQIHMLLFTSMFTHLPFWFDFLTTQLVSAMLFGVRLSGLRCWRVLKMVPVCN